MIKGPKRSPLILRTCVILFVMVCGVYICSFSVKQSNSSENDTFMAKFLNVNIKEEQTCPTMTSDIEESERRYLHYPIPKTFSRSVNLSITLHYIGICSKLLY